MYIPFVCLDCSRNEIGTIKKLIGIIRHIYSQIALYGKARMQSIQSASGHALHETRIKL
ncbi:Uncharacterised protein [uncultured archaeon]|nr:Uncharacterised protein [uncultured archaeon]